MILPGNPGKKGHPKEMPTAMHDVNVNFAAGTSCSIWTTPDNLRVHVRVYVCGYVIDIIKYLAIIVRDNKNKNKKKQKNINHY